MMEDLLSFVPPQERAPLIKQFPVKVMNAGYRTVCSQIGQTIALSCPPAIVQVGRQLERTNRCFVDRVRPRYSAQNRDATHRTLEWYEAIIMLEFYQALTRLHVCSSSSKRCERVIASDLITVHRSHFTACCSFVVSASGCKSHNQTVMK